MINYSEGGILSKEIKSGITLFSMAKGTKISEHTSTKEGFVYVVEGSGVFNLNGEEIEMKEGIFIFLERNVIHSLKAEEDTSFILSLIK